LHQKHGVSGLTIRSSRARFAASALAGYDLTIANAAQRPGLAQALGAMAKLLATIAVLLALSGNCIAQQHCVAAISVKDRNLSIDGSSCSANLETFWRVVETSLPKRLPTNLRSIGLVGYDSPDLIEAMSRSFGVNCKTKSFNSQAFIEQFRKLPESQVRSPTLASLQPTLDSADNFYVLHRSQRGIALRSPGCKFELLRPVLYYRLRPVGT
jgi:hypothetical protein